MDQEKADELLQEVAEALLDDPALAEAEWDSVALVGHLDKGATSIYAYRFVGERAFSVALEGTSLYELLPALREAMVDELSGRWKACLIQIVQPDDIHVEFEHEDGDRWRVTPDNIGDIDRIIEEIRPR